MRKRKTKSILILRKVNNYISIYVLRKFMISVSSNKIHYKLYKIILFIYVHLPITSG